MKKKILISVISVAVALSIIVAIVFGPRLMLAYKLYHIISSDGNYTVTFGLEKVSEEQDSIADFLEEYLINNTGEITGTRTGDTFDGVCQLTEDSLPICSFRNETGEMEFKVGTTLDYLLEKSGLDNDFIKELFSANYDKYVTMSELQSMLGQDAQSDGNITSDLGVALSVSTLQKLEACEQPSDSKILSKSNSFSFYILKDSDFILGVDDEKRIYGSMIKDGFRVEFIYQNK